MNFEGLLAQLKPPPESGEKFFSAIPIYKHSNHRIAINFKGFPYILICVDNDNGLDKRKKIKLKYMNILEYVECNVIEYKKKYTKRFTIIGFESYDKALQLYFLKIGEILLSTVGNTPSYNEVRKCILGFVELFKSMNEPPLKSIQGLWGELFLISNALIPNVLISSWHKNPEDKFDFSLNSDHIEVKTTAVNKREHNFSLEQLNTSKESNVIIASLFVNKVSLGTSIMSLIDIIEKKPEVNTDMIYYLNFII